MKTDYLTVITPCQFFECWKAACLAQQTALLSTWEQSKNYTGSILRNHPPGSVIAQVAACLGLTSYCEYYWLDAILFKEAGEGQDGDRVKNVPPGQTWVHTIRVAFEHEGDFRSGLFQETSHLMIMRAELRVLVTYPERDADDSAFFQSELARLAEIIRATGLPDPAFLLITGRRTHHDGSNWTNIEWKGYLYSGGKFVPLVCP